MAFATRSEVMFIIERLLTQMLWPSFFDVNPYQNRQLKDPELRDSHIDAKTPGLFPRMTYKQAMRFYGSDKPDIRLGSKIQRIERYLPPNLKQMLSPLGDAVFEMIRIDMKGVAPAVSGEFITKFLDAPAAAPYLQNPAGAPGIAVLDPQKPLQGLASFGHEAADKVLSILEPNVGDILIVQARADVPHTGGSTPLGNLRRDIYQSAFAEEILTPPTGDSFLWVVDFPLFSPINDTDPGQGGQAGICSTHHPFTAPVNETHIDLLTKDPLKCDGDHYDLVINGVEVGGGSRRIHDSKLQEFILRDVLKMRPERVEDFRHLLNALKAGCPPHAGFALGFDRLMAILTRQSSMRDVIAFPKWGDGEDKMVGAPSRITEDQLKTYHLGIR
jgi:aspartyl-tRNA synthetase